MVEIFSSEAVSAAQALEARLLRVLLRCEGEGTHLRDCYPVRWKYVRASRNTGKP